MDQQSPASSTGLAQGSRLSPLGQLDRRVRELVEELGEARVARRAAEAEADTLRQLVRERDATIARLREQPGRDDLRLAVRARVEALLRRIDQLEDGA